MELNKRKYKKSQVEDLIIKAKEEFAEELSLSKEKVVELIKQNKKLSLELEEYKNKEALINSAIVRAEQTANEIEKIACCSYYDVGRMFSLIADINISDYIRKRRLTLAGAELKRGNVKVIDVALKYEYDAPVSFARAFQSFHGFNPSSVNNSEAVLNAFPRLIWQISVKGVMDALKIEKLTINGKEYDADYFVLLASQARILKDDFEELEDLLISIDVGNINNCTSNNTTVCELFELYKINKGAIEYER